MASIGSVPKGPRIRRSEDRRLQGERVRAGNVAKVIAEEKESNVRRWRKWNGGETRALGPGRTDANVRGL